MYQKKSRKPILLAAAAAAVLIALLAVSYILPARRRAGKEETEMMSGEMTEAMTEAPRHSILLYKPSAGTVEFDSSWLVSDDGREAQLSVEENTLVTIMITPSAGKTLDSVDVRDYAMKNVEYILHTAYGSDLDTGKEMRLTFVMPDQDVFISFTFSDVITEWTASESTGETEDETQTEEASPYGLALHNLNADIITSFNGMFDERKFLQALGDALHVDSARSEYRTVTDVSFGREEMSDADKISYHVYFNGDELWEVLATYYTGEDSYVFTEVAARTGPETTASKEDAAASETVGSYETCPVPSSGAAGTMPGSSGTVSGTATSFDILSVSTVFLAYVQDEDAFYQAAFDYILQKGCTGSIVGTMSGYEIDPEKKTAVIRIMLSTGGTITATYNKADDTYSFSGL